MNDRVERMIRDVETEYEIEISVDELPDVLCDGDTCRHSECDCWDWYGDELERIAKAKILPPEIVGVGMKIQHAVDQSKKETQNVSSNK